MYAETIMATFFWQQLSIFSTTLQVCVCDCVSTTTYEGLYLEGYESKLYPRRPRPLLRRRRLHFPFSTHDDACSLEGGRDAIRRPSDARGHVSTRVQGEDGKRRREVVRWFNMRTRR